MSICHYPVITVVCSINYLWYYILYLIHQTYSLHSTYSIFSFILCRSLFVLLFFLSWSFCCLYFFDSWILINHLVSSNSSSGTNVSIQMSEFDTKYRIPPNNRKLFKYAEKNRCVPLIKYIYNIQWTALLFLRSLNPNKCVPLTCLFPRP